MWKGKIRERKKEKRSKGEAKNNGGETEGKYRVENLKNIIIQITENHLGRNVMGTFLKYVFYLILIIVMYLVGKGIYDGDITEKTTVGQVVDTVETGAAQMAKDSGNAVKEEIQDYQAQPKKDIKIQ